jgi:hypothetical protein
MRIILVILAGLVALYVRAQLVISRPIVSITSGTLLLDESLSVSAYSAYSVSRKLRSAYAGSAFRVRRSSDSTEQDIGFSGNNVDTSSLTSFVGANSGYIVKVYDQTTNARDLTQATAGNQPRIVNSGTIDTGNDGYPTMVYDGTDDYVAYATGPTTNPMDAFIVVNNVASTAGDIIASGNGTTRSCLQQATSSKFRLDNGVALDDGTYSTGTWYVIFWHAETGTSDSIRQNAGSLTTGSAGNNTPNGLVIGWPTSVCASMKVSEWIVFNAAVGTTDETTLRNNINARYTLF